MLPDRGWMGGAAGWEDGAGTLGWTRQAAKPPPPPHYSLSTCSYTRPADQPTSYRGSVTIHTNYTVHTTHYTVIYIVHYYIITLPFYLILFY